MELVDHVVGVSIQSVTATTVDDEGGTDGRTDGGGGGDVVVVVVMAGSGCAPTDSDMKRGRNAMGRSRIVK